MTGLPEEFFVCKCVDTFSIEDNTLYFGRCRHKHGYNLCKVDDMSGNMMDILNTEREVLRRAVELASIDAVRGAEEVGKDLANDYIKKARILLEMKNK